MKANWILKPQFPELPTRELAQALQIPCFIAQLLQQRGINNRLQAVSFFNPHLQPLHDPFLMYNLLVAVKRIEKAILNQERVLLYGDYDVDGTTAVALMAEQLEILGLSCEFYIPDRYKEGYGVSNLGIDYAMEKGIQLLITLDCGIKAHEQLSRASSHGIDCIVCDHHQPENTLPKAIILNPKQEKCTYPYKELSGCGVAYKLLQGLYVHLGLDQKNLIRSLDLVALSIGADIVELLDENRSLCAMGLKRLNEEPRPAFLAILELASKQLPLSLRDVVFTLAPRINAAGRIASGSRAVDWMRSKDNFQIKSLALAIDNDNTTRRALDQKTTQEALEIIEADVSFSNKVSTVVYNSNWHKGVVGIVASRLIESYYRPTIVLTQTDGVLSGSARCMPPLNLYQLLENCQDHLLQFGGHQFAAGLSLKLTSLEAFKHCFDIEVSKALKGQNLENKINIDTKINFSELGSNTSQDFPRLIKILNAFEPCGPGNLHPVFLAENCIITQIRILKDAHLKLKLIDNHDQEELDAIGFQMANLQQDLIEGMAVDVVFGLKENTFNNKTSLQLILKDLCVSA